MVPLGLKVCLCTLVTVCVCVHTQICMYVFIFTELIQSYTYIFTSESTQIPAYLIHNGHKKTTSEISLDRKAKTIYLK